MITRGVALHLLPLDDFRGDVSGGRGFDGFLVFGPQVGGDAVEGALEEPHHHRVVRQVALLA